jgi:hypothetical protein
MRRPSTDSASDASNSAKVGRLDKMRNCMAVLSTDKWRRICAATGERSTAAPLNSAPADAPIWSGSARQAGLDLSAGTARPPVARLNRPSKKKIRFPDICAQHSGLIGIKPTAQTRAGRPCGRPPG